MKPWLRNIGILAIWLLLWQAASFAIGNDILLAGPVDVVQCLLANVGTLSFWKSIAFSATRIIAGFVLALVLALVLGTLAWRFRCLRLFFAPAVTFIKSVPVVCIIVLLLVWVGSAWVSLIATAFMVFSPVYFNYLEGLLSADKQLAHMLTVFHVGRMQKIRVYFWPAVRPYLISAAKAVVGVSWKAGVAAEIIGIPNGSIGAGIYLAKLGLDTANLFAWTLVIVGLSALCEQLFLAFLKLLSGHSAHLSKNYTPACSGHKRAACTEADDIRLQNATLAYDNKVVLRNVTQHWRAGERYCVMAPSGAGKTTLLACISGLLVPVAGSAHLPDHVAVDFQEDRLLAQLSAWDNIRLVSVLSPQQAAQLKADLDASLSADSSKLFPQECSGGMRRKIALARALAAGGQCVLLDEPFAGLDAQSRLDMVTLVNRYLEGRTLLFATHNPYDAKDLQAQRIQLPAASCNTE